DFHLVDTATRTNVWSDHLQRERGDPIRVADETARGIARVLAVEIGHLRALRVRGKPSPDLTLSELVARGYLSIQRGATGESLSEAMASFDEALRRDPHYQPALLAVARVHIIAAMNFIDLDFSPDLGKAEQLVNEALAKSPNSIPALYSLALLQKYRHQYHASIRLCNAASSSIQASFRRRARSEISSLGSDNRRRGWNKFFRPFVSQPPMIRRQATGIFSPPRQSSSSATIGPL